MATQILSATQADWEAIRRIYRDGIRTKEATFQTEADIPDGTSWFASKMEGLIFKAVNEEGKIIGWSALSPVSSRCVYRGVAEVSVYVDLAQHGRGVGTMLLAHLIEASEEQGIWTLQAGIFPSNIASVNLHKKLGFREVGLRERLGQMDGVWRDVLFLERRSDKIG